MSRDSWDKIDAEDKQSVAKELISFVDWIADKDTYRILDCRVLEDLYNGKWVTSDDMMPGIAAFTDMFGSPVKLNFAKNAVDFVHTKICAETPSVVVTSKRGGYQSKRKAESLTKYIQSVVEHANVEELGPKAVLCALRTGTVIVKTFSINGHPNAEIVPAENVFVDHQEARSGNTRSIYERRAYPRAQLLMQYQDDEDICDALENAPAAHDPLVIGASSNDGLSADLIDLYEAWTLPSIDDSSPGRHVICVQDYTIIDEEWTCQRFPYAVFRIVEKAPGRGWWGNGLLEQLDESQAEIEFLLEQVSEQIRLARLKIFVKDREIEKNIEYLRSSEQGSIVPYSDTPPIASTMPTVSREALEHINWLLSKLYETAGMSEQAASSQRPAGINSGRAILFFHDFQTKRFVDLVKRYNQFIIDIAERLIDRALESKDELLDDEDDTLNVSEIEFDRKEFKFAIETISSIPLSYSGRMQRIEQLISQGQIPEGYWTQYLADPDAWRAEHRASTQANFIDWMISELHNVENDMPVVPDQLDFELAIEVLGGEVLDLIRQGADQNIIDRFEDQIDAIVNRQKEIMMASQIDATTTQQPTAEASAPQLPNGGLNPTQA